MPANLLFAGMARSYTRFFMIIPSPKISEKRSERRQS